MALHDIRTEVRSELEKKKFRGNVCHIRINHETINTTPRSEIEHVSKSIGNKYMCKRGIRLGSVDGDNVLDIRTNNKRLFLGRAEDNTLDPIARNAILDL